MDKNIIDEINLFVQKVIKILPVKMITLYGSYARGTQGPESDIDIAVVVDDIQENWLKLNSKLFLIAAEIDYKIEPNLIILKNNTSDFLESIMKYGKIVYQVA
ncbi:MAG: nucleotidyltransferase domain-containing protein [Candidatus Desantisbacteria bacterium]